MKKILFLAIALFGLSEISWGLIKFTYVAPSTGEIHIKNFGTSPVNIASYRLCSLFDYATLTNFNISILQGDFDLAAGEEVAITWNAPTGFTASASDLGLYLPSGVFSSASAMVDFMQYGAAGQGRENVANTAGLWTAGTFLTGTGPWYYFGSGTISGVDQWTSNAPVDVTFQVDMSQQTISPNGVHFAGSMQGWDAAASPMTDNGNGLYSIEFTLFEGDYQYKFINGNSFAQVEIVPGSCGVNDGFGGFNRSVAIGTENIMLEAVCFGECSTCANPINITFNLDAGNETISPEGIHLVGSFQNWTLPGILMSDNGNGIFSYTTQLPANSDYEYRFLNGIDYTGSETVPSNCGVDDGFGGYNRFVAAASNDITLDTVCFSSCTTCPEPPQEINLTFFVNMSDEVIDPNGIHVIGSFNNWDFAAAPMTDVDLDGVYTYSAIVPQNSQVFYKFVNGNTQGQEELVPAQCALADGNNGQSRVVYTLLEDISADTVCYASCTNCGEIIDVPSNLITLQVNMQDEIVSPLGVHVAGNFQNWDPSTHEMTDLDEDGIYTITIETDEWANLSYKFINGNTWNEVEVVPSACGLPDGNGGNNRILETGTIDFIAPPVCFSSCEDCQDVQPEIVNVTFYVNMQQEIISPDGVYLSGPFNNWISNETPMTDEDQDGIYTYTQAVEANTTLEYLFLNGDEWVFAESIPLTCQMGGNRFVEVGDTDMVLDTVCFNYCVNCDDIVAPITVTVVFQVDMSNETPSPQGIHIAGDFQGWNPNGTVMTELGGGIYEISYEVLNNQTIHFKFINGSDWNSAEIVPAACGVDDGFGAINRTLVIGNENLVYGPVCFSSCSACEPVIEPQTVNVTFLIDMNNETVDPNGVHIAGNFQNWQPDTSEMLDSNSDGIYEYTAAIDTNSTVLFKFINGNNWPMQETVPSACGEDDGFGGFNRMLDVAESNVTFGPVCFSECAACAIPTPVLVTFQVDMTNESISGDGVFIAGDFNNWDVTATQMSEFSPGQFQAAVVMNSGESTQYKFINGMDWAGAEIVPLECGVNDGNGNFNRTFTAGNSNQTVGLVCFSSCTSCVVVPMVDVTFQLDLGNLTADPAGVHLAGTFNGFSPTANEMTLAFDNVYTATVSIPENTEVQFKYINGTSWTNAEVVPFECGTPDGQGGYNRFVNSDDSGFTLPQVCFSLCADCVVGIEDLEDHGIHIYPNPAEHEIFISIHNVTHEELRIFDSLGHLVHIQSNISSSTKIDLEHFAPGIYSIIIPGYTAESFIVK